jgi:hypothetical protein
LKRKIADFKQSKSLFIGLIICLILRFPYFIQGEIGVDTFNFNILINLFVKDGKIDYISSFLSIFEYYPDSIITSPIILGSSFVFMAGLPPYISVFINSLNSGCMASLFFYMLLNSPFFVKRFNMTERNITALLFISLPLLLKFTDWSFTGRTVFFLISPLVLTIYFNILYERNDKSINLIFLIFTWGLIFLGLLLSHGMARILFIYLVLAKFLQFIDRILEKVKIIQRNKKGFTLILILIGALTFFIPYLLQILYNNHSLVNPWVVQRSILTSSFVYLELKFLLGFMFMFLARLTFTGVIFLISYFTLPLLNVEKSKDIKILLIGVYFVAPFFVDSMYFYQAIVPIIVIITGKTFYYFFEKGTQLFTNFTNKIHKQLVKSNIYYELGQLKILRKLKQKKKIISIKKFRMEYILVFFLLINFLTTMGIQYYRSSNEDEGHSISIKNIEISKFLDETYEDEPGSVCSNSLLAQQISAYSIHITPFPMTRVVFFEKYPEYKNNVLISPVSFEISISKLIYVFRYGIYTSNSYRLLNNYNEILFDNSQNEEEKYDKFMQFKDEFNIRLLVHDVGDDWKILSILKSKGEIKLIKTWDTLHLYEITS